MLPGIHFCREKWGSSFLNQRAVKLLGYEDSNLLIGRPLLHYLGNDMENDQQRLVELLTKHNINETEQFIEKLVRKDGSFIWTEIIAIPFKY
ncbi:PAS domain-containing protein [Mesobacillus campisalis]|uniref:PAS domain-containing protein n=1 Tax=Mesobacillus campisalis TaxID=1408103 RepID=UPI0012E24063